jgi:hypothetical protein
MVLQISQNVRSCSFNSGSRHLPDRLYKFMLYKWVSSRENQRITLGHIFVNDGLPEMSSFPDHLELNSTYPFSYDDGRLPHLHTLLFNVEPLLYCTIFSREYYVGPVELGL